MRQRGGYASGPMPASGRPPKPRMFTVAGNQATPKRPLELDATCSHERCIDAGTYTLTGRCGNCGARVVGTFTRGHEANDRTLGKSCPRCDCSCLYWDRGQR